MAHKLHRRNFIRNTALVGSGLGFVPSYRSFTKANQIDSKKRVGIIGLDTSHSIAFTKALNEANTPAFEGYKVVAAYPNGSLDIASSVERIPKYTEEIRELGVEIVNSIADLLEKVEVVLLETNDGRRHLEQAIQVFKANKRVFIDKPFAASLSDAIAIFDLAKYYKVPTFSSSSLRFTSSAQEITHGKIGKVLGADVYSPCNIEKTHPDLFWYGIHGVELLYTVMGIGCMELTRVHTQGTDVVVGTWEDGRIGTFRGTRTGIYKIGGIAFGEHENAVLTAIEGYGPLLREIIDFFETGNVPVKEAETLEIYAFMEAADKSNLICGGQVNIDKVHKIAIEEAEKKLNDLKL